MAQCRPGIALRPAKASFYTIACRQKRRAAAAQELDLIKAMFTN
jgi:hypothetical protein